MSLNGKFLDKDHLQYFWTKIKMKFASAEQGAKADTAVQPSALTDYQTKLSGTNKLDPAYIAYDATHRAVTDTEKSTWNGKQSALTTEQLAAVNSGIDSADVAQIETNKNNISTLNNEINYAVNTGVKNLLKITGTTASSNGIKYTVNQDGTVAVTGTATANSFFTVGSLSGYIGDVILSGCPANGGYQKWRLFKDGSNPSQSDIGNGMTYTLDGTSENYVIEIYNGQGFTDANPFIFRPMLRLASITDSTFQPYALPNPTLTPAVIEQVDSGAKNLLRNTASSQVLGGVTFTVSDDGTIIANGTKTNNDWLYLSVGNKLKADTYVLSSGLAPQSDSSIRLIITTADSLGSAIMGTEGKRQVYVKQLTSDYTGLYYAIRISSGTTVNNLTFKPMICTAADWAISQKFVPYRPSYDDVATKAVSVGLTIIPQALTLQHFNSVTEGTETGFDDGSVSGISGGQWIVVRTYTLNKEGTRIMQIVETRKGVRRTRLYDGTSWSSFIEG